MGLKEEEFISFYIFYEIYLRHERRTKAFGESGREFRLGNEFYSFLVFVFVTLVRNRFFMVIQLVLLYDRLVAMLLWMKLMEKQHRIRNK